LTEKGGLLTTHAEVQLATPFYGEFWRLEQLPLLPVEQLRRRRGV
jgi:hypothetical protein